MADLPVTSPLSSAAHPREAGFDVSLARAAVALNSSLALPAVLQTLAEVTLEVTDAARASLFLVEGDRLVPAVSLGGRTDPDLLQAFRQMPPIQLDDARAALLADGLPVPVPDAASSPVMPPGWAQRFDVQSAVVVLLQTAGAPCGLLAVDYPARDRFHQAELSRVAAIAALAGVAIAQAHTRDQVVRDHERAAEQARVADELRHNVGRLFEFMHQRAGALARQAPHDHPWRTRAVELVRLADGGSFQVEQAIRRLDHQPTDDRDLAEAVRDLADDLQQVAGIDVVVEVTGDPGAIGPHVEQRLYRIVHEALTAAWRHGRCSFARITLTLDTDQVHIAIVDDGAGLRARHATTVTGHELLAIRRDLTDIDGTLQVTELAPHGLKLEVTAPLRRDHVEIRP